MTCPECEGSGLVFEVKCPYCNGGRGDFPNSTSSSPPPPPPDPPEEEDQSE